MISISCFSSLLTFHHVKYVKLIARIQLVSAAPLNRGEWTGGVGGLSSHPKHE